jgi:hypothetical protein
MAQPLQLFAVIRMVRVPKYVAEFGVAPHPTAVLGRAGPPASKADGVRYPVRRQDVFDEHVVLQESPKS